MSSESLTSEQQIEALLSSGRCGPLTVSWLEALKEKIQADEMSLTDGTALEKLYDLFFQ